MVVVAPDKFKGSLTAEQAGAHIQAGLLAFDSRIEVRRRLVADGGDGTVDAVATAGFAREQVVVTGPTGQPVSAAFAHRGSTAVVELAEASGLRRLPHGGAAPLRASSHGTGELIRAALDRGCRQIVLGVGGSASSDGGAGMLQALGARLLDPDCDPVQPGGGGLTSIHTIDLSTLDARLRDAAVVLASDVDNPLLGPEGAAAVYAPQKGADAGDVAQLEAGLQHWADLMRSATGGDVASRAGAGAAGGVGFAALAALGAERRPGVDVLLELVGFEALLDGAALVVTGEGSLDRQSLRGKVPGGVAAAARRAGVAAVAVVGRTELSQTEALAIGVRATYALTAIEPDESRSLRRAGALVRQIVTERLAPDWLAH